MIVLYINKEKVRVISVSNMRTKAMSNRGDRANERILITPIIDILMTLYTQKNKKVEPVFELKTERFLSLTILISEYMVEPIFYYITRLICLK